ncbi:MAG TPA: hypothetical protein VH502_15990 [Actinoplanes sp.]|jgi:hypothetical protein
MRRLVFPIMMAAGLVMIGPGGASAAPAPSADAAQASAGKKICKVTDPRLDELSGIVATQRGFIVINDSTTLDSHKRVFYLNDECTVTKSVRFSGNGPRDTEDMVLSSDGETLWIADIGDNELQRDTIALWTMPADGSERPRVHRLSYPAGERHDAEAMLLGGDGTPIIVTKEVGAPAGIYTPAAALKTDNVTGVPLKRVGQLTVPPSTTSASAFARLGRGTIDGGAIAPGGGRVALRTYTDALEWTVSGGDVLTAVQGKPRVTPLPDEPLGEAITYSSDGRYFYTVSDMQGRPSEADNYILRYTPATKTAAAQTAAAEADDNGPSWFSSLTINDITYLVGAVGLLGAILVGLGVFGIMRSRKRPPAQRSRVGGGPTGPDPTDADTEFVGVGGAQGQRSGQPGAYRVRQPGSAQPGVGPPGVGSPGVGQPGVGQPEVRQPGTYGGRPATSTPRRGAPQRGSGVYGGAPPAGGAGAGQDPARRGQGVPGGSRRDYDNPGYGGGAPYR